VVEVEIYSKNRKNEGKYCTHNTYMTTHFPGLVQVLQ